MINKLRCKFNTRKTKDTFFDLYYGDKSNKRLLILYSFSNNDIL